ncbi:MAG: GH25 family lysozyme [Bacteroidales bacterium]|nr:GH25 family lysozyme [Bacteroidales bacterium]
MSIYPHRLKIWLIALLLTMVAGAAHAQVTVDGSSANLIYDGIDVSSYQKDIDWSATAQDKNIKFVYVKATEGATYRSRHYQFNIENARKHGIHVGAYHFLRPNIPVIKQFHNFTSIVKKEDQDLIPLIDVEVRGNITAQALADSTLLFADMLEKHYGCRPMIYTGSAFYNSYLSGRISGYPLFIARYSKVEPKLTGGVKWVLWQFSEKGVIAGIDHVVDLCRFNKGCGLKDILIKGRKAMDRPAARPQETVPPRPAKKEQPAVVEKQLSEKEKEQLRKEREKAEKEARKLAEKRAAEEKKEAERLAKQKEKLRKLREKEEREAAKQEQKRREKEEKLRQEQAEKDAKARQEKAEREAKAREEALKKKEKERAEAERQRQLQAEKAAKAKRDREEQLRKQQEQKRAQEKAAKKQSQNQKASSQGKRVNQSSIDNEDY